MPDNAQKPKKLTGSIFWLVFLLALAKDAFDAVSNFTIVLSVLTLITGPVFTFIIFSYYFLEGVPVTTKKVVTWATTTLIGFIPFVNLLPEATLNLVITRILNNNETLAKATSVASPKSIAKKVS